jgi:hypothetical protein
MPSIAVGAPGRGRGDGVAAVAARTAVVASADRRLTLHGVVAVIGGLQTTIGIAQVAQLFADRFKTTASRVEATVHAPGEYLLYFADPATRRAALVIQGPLVLGGASFLLTPWGRLRRAMPAFLPYKARVCIEGVPEHARDPDSIAPLFAGQALVDSVDEVALSDQETACIRLWVWMEDVGRLATRGTLKREEPIEVDSPLVHFPELGIYADIPSRVGPVSVCSSMKSLSTLAGLSTTASALKGVQRATAATTVMLAACLLKLRPGRMVLSPGRTVGRLGWRTNLIVMSSGPRSVIKNSGM